MARRSIRFLTDDPLPPTRQEQLAGTLFDETPSPLERRPTVEHRGAEQRTMPIEGTDAGWYQRWRADPRSEQVLDALRDEARRRRQLFPRGKLGGRNLWEAVRILLQPQGLSPFMNNNAQAMACREVEESTPDLVGRFRHRSMKEGEAA